MDEDEFFDPREAELAEMEVRRVLSFASRVISLIVCMYESFFDPREADLAEMEVRCAQCSRLHENDR